MCGVCGVCGVCGGCGVCGCGCGCSAGGGRNAAPPRGEKGPSAPLGGVDLGNNTSFL